MKKIKRRHCGQILCTPFCDEEKHTTLDVHEHEQEENVFVTKTEMKDLQEKSEDCSPLQSPLPIKQTVATVIFSKCDDEKHMIPELHEHEQKKTAFVPNKETEELREGTADCTHLQFSGPSNQTSATIAQPTKRIEASMEIF